MTEISPPAPAPEPNTFRALASTVNGRELMSEEALEIWLGALDRHNGVPAEDPVRVTWEKIWEPGNPSWRWVITGPAYAKGMKP